MSVTETVLVTSIEGVTVILTIVGSFGVAVFGSSEVSVTVPPLGVVALPVAIFITLFESTACWLIIKKPM